MTDSPMSISLSGLEVEWRRFEVIAENISNLSSVTMADGSAYRPMRLVSAPKGGFDRTLAAREPRAVEVLGIEPMNVAPRRVHEPDHPGADAEGFVEYPGTSYSAEMVLLVQTARNYEANLVALNAARQMYAKALEIGRRG